MSANRPIKYRLTAGSPPFRARYCVTAKLPPSGESSSEEAPPSIARLSIGFNVPFVHVSDADRPTSHPSPERKSRQISAIVLVRPPPTRRPVPRIIVIAAPTPMSVVVAEMASGFEMSEPGRSPAIDKAAMTNNAARPPRRRTSSHASRGVFRNVSRRASARARMTAMTSKATAATKVPAAPSCPIESSQPTLRATTSARPMPIAPAAAMAVVSPGRKSTNRMGRMATPASPAMAKVTNRARARSRAAVVPTGPTAAGRRPSLTSIASRAAWSARTSCAATGTLHLRPRWSVALSVRSSPAAPMRKSVRSPYAIAR